VARLSARVNIASCCGCLLFSSVNAEPIRIDSRREPMVDQYLIERFVGEAELRLHQPTPREVVLVSDRPWEGNLLFHVTVFRDETRFRMYYRGYHFNEATGKTFPHKVICYAESTDGISWTRPELGIVEFNGSKKNNIIIDTRAEGIASNGAFAVFKDENPECTADAKYKAIAIHRINGKGLYPFKSPDGIHWSHMHYQPGITKGAFDSHNLAFWDAERQEYRAYWRYFDKARGNVRAIRTAASKDFIHWSNPVDLSYPGSPNEHLYTNAIRPYARAPHIFLGFPKRFILDRKPLVQHANPGVSDAVFMSSRDGLNFKRWGEAFIRPGPQNDAWVNRNLFTSWGILKTRSAVPGTPDELSLYVTEGYYTGPNTRLRRYTLRQDGFVSVQAPLSGGEFISKPLLFTGNRLSINFSTSAAGSIRFELQDSEGAPLPGYTMNDCPEIFGDTLDHVVSWKNGPKVGHLKNQPIRLRCKLKDADLFSLRFIP